MEEIMKKLTLFIALSMVISSMNTIADSAVKDFANQVLPGYEQRNKNTLKVRGAITRAFDNNGTFDKNDLDAQDKRENFIHTTKIMDVLGYKTVFWSTMYAGTIFTPPVAAALALAGGATVGASYALRNIAQKEYLECYGKKAPNMLLPEREQARETIIKNVTWVAKNSPKDTFTNSPQDLGF